MKLCEKSKVVGLLIHDVQRAHAVGKQRGYFLRELLPATRLALVTGTRLFGDVDLLLCPRVLRNRVGVACRGSPRGIS